MHVKARSYLTAGIATLGVGALALAPVQPIPNQIALSPERVISTLAVELAASTIDPIAPWVDTFTTAGANIATLVEFYLQKPFPILQTIVANLGTYATELENGQGDLIPEQIWGNVQTFFQAPWDPGAIFTWDPPFWPVPNGTVTQPWPDPDAGFGYVTSSATQPNPPGIAGPVSPRGLLELIAQPLAGAFLSDSYEELATDDPTLAALWDTAVKISDTGLWTLSATPASGQLVALLGPVISPLVQLTRSFTAIGQYFQDGEVAAAINALINIPADTTNAFLNGLNQPLDLTGIVSNFAPLPDGYRVGLQLGGLLNSQPYNGSLKDPENPPTEYTGGTAWNSLSIIDAPDGFVKDQLAWGLKNGWAGSVVGLGQYLGQQLLVTPPAPPPVAAEPEAAKLAAPADISAVAEASVEESAPAVVDVPAEESAPAVAEVVAEDPAPTAAEVAAEDTAPAVDDIAEVEAAIEVAEVAESEPAEAATPAAEDSGPEAADSDTSDDDTDRSGSKNRRGAS
jgi:hypothetical protein